MLEGLVSIITPCWNGSKYIAETIDSVINQTYQNWELLIIDDGSTDISAEIALNYCKKDSRIHLFQQKNAGAASARNNGIRQAQGQYIALLDSDDIWESNFLKDQIGFMKEKKALLVYSSYKRIDGSSKEILSPFICKPQVSLKQMQVTNHIGCLTGLYDTSIYGKVFLREELKSIRDDYAYWLDIIKKTGIAYGNPKILARYRVLASSTTGKKKKLIKHQFLFYFKHQKLGLFRSCFNTVYWIIYGLIKFSR